ncbi:MAG: hypothetical protein EAZ55_05040 [Cytophagales bacterium]|nr:MAG: hypothetical protein EAZ55_05040 [Cytophagales bacterium]
MQCTSKNEKPALSIPSAYEGANFSSNTTTQSAIRVQLENLTNEMKKGRTTGVSVSATTLNTLFASTGSNSLRSVSTSYYVGRLEGSTGWLQTLASASGSTWIPANNATQGGTFGGYLFSKEGLEMEQMVEKGLFGAALYYQASLLWSANELSLANVDQILSLYGAHPDFPNSNNAKYTNPDKFMALYAARRDKNDGKGFYTQIKENFIKLQAAVKAGSDYKAEQQEYLANIKLLWEKANAATVINYCHSVISTLSATSPTDAQKGAALHAYGECVGFLHGWLTITDKKITDTQIESLLTLLNAPRNGAPTSYSFVTDASNQLPKLQQVISQLKSIYGFTDAEIEDFKQNWITVQNR